MKLDKAFPSMPESFEDAMREGIRKGKQKMKLRNKIKVASIVAALAACVLVVAFATGNGGKLDNTVAASPTPDSMNRDEQIVFAVEQGNFYHSNPECSRMMGASECNVANAEANGKMPCPICLSNVKLNVSDCYQKALDMIENVFPNFVAVYQKHYNNASTLGDKIWRETDVVYVEFEAKGVTIARVAFFENTTYIDFFFNDAKLFNEFSTEMQVNSLAEELIVMDHNCKEELIPGIMKVMSSSDQSFELAHGEAYTLEMLILEFTDKECLSANFRYFSQYRNSFSITFELADGDKLSDTHILHYNPVLMSEESDGAEDDGQQTVP